MKRKVFTKKFAMPKRQAKELQNILNLGTDAVRIGLVEPGDISFLYTAKFKNNYYMTIEVTTPNFDKESIEDDDDFGTYLDMYLYNEFDEEVDRCGSRDKNILGEYKLFDTQDNKYIVDLIAI